MNSFIHLFVISLTVENAEIPKIAVQSQCLAVILNLNLPSHLYLMQVIFSPI